MLLCMPPRRPPRKLPAVLAGLGLAGVGLWFGIRAVPTASALSPAPETVLVMHLGSQGASATDLMPASVALPERVRWVKALRDTVLVQAWRQLDKPYVWGGTSPRGGFDCSGLLFFSFQQAGLRLPRTAAEQSRLGQPVRLDPRVMQPGDLIAFRTRGWVDHIGLYLGNGRYIHASGAADEVTLGNLANPRDLAWRVPVDVRRLFVLPTASQLEAYAEQQVAGAQTQRPSGGL